LHSSSSITLKVDGAGADTAIFGRFNADHYGFLGTDSHGVEGYNLGATVGMLAFMVIIILHH